MYVITKVNRYYSHGALVTHEKFFKETESLDEVLAIAKKQKENVEEIRQELEEYGITAFKGYMVDIW